MCKGLKPGAILCLPDCLSFLSSPPRRGGRSRLPSSLSEPLVRIVLQTPQIEAHNINARFVGFDQVSSELRSVNSEVLLFPGIADQGRSLRAPVPQCWLAGSACSHALEHEVTISLASARPRSVDTEFPLVNIAARWLPRNGSPPWQRRLTEVTLPTHGNVHGGAAIVEEEHSTTTVGEVFTPNLARSIRPNALGLFRQCILANCNEPGRGENPQGCAAHCARIVAKHEG
eukprot:scaffold61712_cov69-Phaeocystis_antarctica.AAC.18